MSEEQVLVRSISDEELQAESRSEDRFWWPPLWVMASAIVTSTAVIGLVLAQQ